MIHVQNLYIFASLFDSKLVQLSVFELTGVIKKVHLHQIKANTNNSCVVSGVTFGK